MAFVSDASDLVAGDTNGASDVFVRDRRDRFAGVTRRVSVGRDGQEANGDSFLAAISANGRYVASDASNLVARDTNERRDVFVRDRSGDSVRNGSSAQ